MVVWNITRSLWLLLQTLGLVGVLLGLSSLVLTYGIAIVTYRKFFHPLRHFPGPPLCTISKLPAFYLAWTGKKVPFLEKAHREYGDIVRINPDELSIIGADVWKDTHGRSTKFQDAKGPLPKHWEKNVHSPNGVYNLFDAPDAEHARMRKRFSPAFSERALQKQQALFQEVADRFITKLSAQMGEKIDLVRMLNFTTFDIMSELAFGDSLNMLERNEYCPWVRVMFDFIKIDARMKAMGQLMSPLQALARVLFGGYIEKKKSDHFRFSEERVSHRLKVGSEKADIWNLLLKPKEHMESLTKGEMDSNAFVLMIAGTETVATVLAGLIYFMLKNPAKMDHLTNEVRNAFHGTDPITLKGVNKLQYLSACIEETLRLYPPTPTGTARAVPNPGSTICGSFIPGGSTVYVSHRAIYTSEKYFKEPYSFVPERWLGDERYKDDNKSILQPFSQGPRNCIGKSMAYYEMRLIAAKFFYHFDARICPEAEDWIDQATYFLWEKRPLNVTVKLARELGD